MPQLGPPTIPTGSTYPLCRRKLPPASLGVCELTFKRASLDCFFLLYTIALYPACWTRSNTISILFGAQESNTIYNSANTLYRITRILSRNCSFSLVVPFLDPKLCPGVARICVTQLRNCARLCSQNSYGMSYVYFYSVGVITPIKFVFYGTRCALPHFRQLKHAERAFKRLWYHGVPYIRDPCITPSHLVLWSLNIVSCWWRLDKRTIYLGNL